ncbi:MAG: protein-glutamate O-methyltransferase CheR [Pseudomonadota bacterium]
MNDMTQPATLSDTEFRQIIAIAFKEAGLEIPEAKKSLVQSRVARRMRALGFDDCHGYLAALDGNDEETENLVSALTTNVSHFFREMHHFQTLREAFLTSPSPGKLRFWSAGCSNGQEPYSLAIEILRKVPDAANRDILILASDIDRNVLNKAQKGIYTSSEIENVPLEDRNAFFHSRDDGTYEAKEALKALVRFRQLNLNGPTWPMQGPFDAILCRNVVIYFNDKTQAKLWPRFRALLKPQGYLMLGHSERIQDPAESGFETAGVTTYRTT